jgi:hypothetical protein
MSLLLTYVPLGKPSVPVACPDCDGEANAVVWAGQLADHALHVVVTCACNCGWRENR